MKLNQLQLFSIIVLLVGGLLFLFPPAKKRIVKPLVYRALLSYENFPERSAHQKSRWDQFQSLSTNSTDVIFLGDSLIEAGQWSELLSGKVIRNRGVSGQTLRGLLKHINVISTWSFERLYLLVGINDIINGEKLSELHKNYETLLESLRQTHSAKKIYLISLLPVSGKELSRHNHKILKTNETLRAFAIKFDMNYIEAYKQMADNESLPASMTYDGLHLNGAGYLKLSEILQY